MNVKLMKELIARAEEEITERSKFIKDTKQEIAEHLCPFKVGEEVLNKDGEREIIASISYCSWNRINYDFKIFKIKKSGEPYKQSHHAWNEEKYTRYLHTEGDSK